MRKIKWNIRLDPAMQDGEFKAPDDATNDEIEELAKEEAFNGVDWGWVEVKEFPVNDIEYIAEIDWDESGNDGGEVKNA